MYQGKTRKAIMHITSEEIALSSLLVVALAVVASFAAPVITSRSQRDLTREQYLIKQRTKTYLDAMTLAARHREGSEHGGLAVTAPVNVRMSAYASHDAYNTWLGYLHLMAISEWRQDKENPKLRKELQKEVQAAEDAFIRQVRQDLGTPGPFNGANRTFDGKDPHENRLIALTIQTLLNRAVDEEPEPRQTSAEGPSADAEPAADSPAS
jgi:hypothetical protein